MCVSVRGSVLYKICRVIDAFSLQSAICEDTRTRSCLKAGYDAEALVTNKILAEHIEPREGLVKEQLCYLFLYE